MLGTEHGDANQIRHFGMASRRGRGIHLRQRAAGGHRNRAPRGSQKPSGARVIVGRDPRFLGETFCAIAAEVLAAHGITPLMIAEAAPTPAISYAVMREKADGAINFTASHNPPEYNGIKFSTPDGAPALPEVTKHIEAEIAAQRRGGRPGFRAAPAQAAGQPAT